MIAIIDQVVCGGALQLVLQPPDGAKLYRITRGDSEGELVDENAGTIIYEDTYPAFMDGPGLVNGQTYWYRAFYLIGPSWVASPANSQRPVVNFTDYSADPMGLLRDCLSTGLKEYVRRRILNPASGSIAVLFGMPEVDNANFPLVILHMARDADEKRALGEVIKDPATGLEFEGWMSSVTINITVGSENYDERVAMRKAIKAIVIANLAIFQAAGIVTPSLSLSDQDDTTTYSAAIYSVQATFTCLAPSFIGETREVIDDVEVQLTVIGGG